MTPHALMLRRSLSALIGAFSVARRRTAGCHRLSATLEIKQLITVRNISKPPRTLTKERALEVQLPPEARIQSGLVQIEFLRCALAIRALQWSTGCRIGAKL